MQRALPLVGLAGASMLAAVRLAWRRATDIASHSPAAPLDHPCNPIPGYEPHTVHRGCAISPAQAPGHEAGGSPLPSAPQRSCSKEARR